jgi:hypothetical protein
MGATFIVYESLICVLLSVFGLVSTRFKFLGLRNYVFVLIISFLLVITRYFFSQNKLRLFSIPTSFLLLFLSLMSPKVFLISLVALYIFSIEMFSPFEFGRKIPFLIKPVIFTIFYFLGFYSVANPFSFAMYDSIYYAILVLFFGFFFSLSIKNFFFVFPNILLFPIFHSSLPVIALSVFVVLSLFFMRKNSSSVPPPSCSLFIFIYLHYFILL